MMRLNLKYGAATAVASIVSSALLAWSVKHFTFSPGMVLPFDDRFYMMAPTAWLYWRIDIILLMISVIAAGTRLKKINSRPVSTFARVQVLPVAAVMVLSALLHFVTAGEAGFVWGFWVSFTVALLTGQVTALINNLDNIDCRKASTAQ
ncbi:MULTISPECIES: hypothetical protein [Enterobacterales]|uniref:hypothetical protein n=1 Tax=Enterobacterales TaxID=91347 RepID=UPI000CEC8604|nr:MULTISPECIES: hypothetical protein [Enterobacterales]ROC77442.1 hypothetical protein C4Z25_014705 [Enterobacter hormaechei subsp. steigerwaltii]